MSSNRKYFAASESEECARVLMGKATSFYQVITANSYVDTLRHMWRAYHGIYNDDVDGSHEIKFGGEQGEIVHLNVNHFRNLAQHMVVMITANRPVMKARAINTDAKSMSQAYLADGILDYYMREKHLEKVLRDAVEMAVVMGSSFVKMEWNAMAGDEFDFDEETNERAYTGELEFSKLSPLDVVFDGTKESWDQDWVLCRSSKNRYDLIAKYPEYEDRILGLQSKDQVLGFSTSTFSNDETDDVFIYEFYHKRTEAVPEGRYMLFLDTDIVLLDTSLPYRQVPVFRISASDIMGTPYGYSPMFDVYPIQEGINSLYSTIMTNQNATGIQNIWVKPGSDLNVENIGGSLNIIETENKPEPLQLTATPQEVFSFLETLIQSAETVSGVNSVARGNPEASLKSGTALALVQSMSLQFMSGLQQSYVRLIEDVGTALINILKDFATTPKVVALVGKNNRPLLQEFTGEKISSISRVIVDVGNPLANSTAGKVQIAEQMLQMGIIKNPAQYFQVMNTGRLDAAFEDEMDELLLIKRENELLMEGNPPIVSPLDKHNEHIMEHRAVLADPDLRTNPDLVRIVLEHIQGHIDALRNTDPALLQLIGQQPLPPAGAPMGPEGAPPQGEGPPPGQEGDGMAPPPTGYPQVGEEVVGPNAEGVGLPNLPQPPAPFADMPVMADQVVPQS